MKGVSETDTPQRAEEILMDCVWDFDNAAYGGVKSSMTTFTNKEIDSDVYETINDEEFNDEFHHQEDFCNGTYEMFEKLHTPTSVSENHDNSSYNEKDSGINSGNDNLRLEVNNQQYLIPKELDHNPYDQIVETGDVSANKSTNEQHYDCLTQNAAEEIQKNVGQQFGKDFTKNTDAITERPAATEFNDQNEANEYCSMGPMENDSYVKFKC